MKKTDCKIVTESQNCHPLWPQLLEHNECDIKSSNTHEYFMPKQQFDHIWAYEFLAEKCYQNYIQPLVFQGKIPVEKAIVAEKKIDQLPYREEKDILPLDQQIALLQRDREIRLKLADDFANCKFPWYIQRPSYQYDFKITTEMQQCFGKPFEFEILQGIQHFQCQLMIINVAFDVPARNLECWLKFSPYVAIVAVIHNKDLYRKLKNFNCAFQLVLKDEPTAISWQEELTCNLIVGLQKAKDLFLYDDSSRAFVYIFSLSRGICVLDKFKFLRKT